MVVFYEEMSPKMRISNIDATDDFIYFAYSTYGIVAVYDWNGLYQYSLAFFSHTNGSLGMRLDNGLLYVHDNEGYEFIFSGNELIQKLPPAERIHTIGWFHSKANIPVYAASGQLYSQSGEFIMALPGKLT